MSRVINMINREKMQSEKEMRKKIKLRVYEAYAIAQNIYQENKGIKKQFEIQKMIVDALRAVRFEQGKGYYFIIDTLGENILDPLSPSIEGTNILNNRDSKNKYIVRDLLELLKANDEVFITGYLPKLNIDRNKYFKKISFVKHLDFSNLLIGTGLYINDIKKQLKEEILDRIGSVYFGENMDRYIFVVSHDGTLLMSNAQRNLIGQNIIRNAGSDNLTMVHIQKKIAKHPEGDFISYSWNKPYVKQIASKISFIQEVKGWKWIIGSGFYLDDVENEIMIMQTELYNSIQLKIIYSTLCVVGIIALFLFLLKFLTNKLKNDFNLFISFFNNAANSKKEIDRNQVQFVELDRVAKDANLMLKDLWESKSQLTTLIHASPDIICFKDANGKLLIANNAYLHFYNLENVDYSNKTIQELISDDSSLYKELSLNCIASDEKAWRGEEIYISEEYFKNSDKVKVIYEVIKVPIFENNGSKKGLVILGRNITKRKELELQLQFLNEDLEAQVKIEVEKVRFQEDIIQQQKRFADMGKMINAIAHQWRQPLNNIYIIMQMIQETNSGEDYGVELDELYQQHDNLIHFMSKTIDDFRNYFAVEKEKKEFNIVNEIIKTALLLRAQMNSNNIGLNIHCGCEKNSFDYNNDIEADDYCNTGHDIFYGQPGEFRQVILNILNNATDAILEKRKHGWDGGAIYLNIKLDDNNFNIFIQNTGDTIEKKVLKKIFDPYFTTKEEGKGTGIGLYMSQMIIKNDMGGSISVKNINDGVEFCIRLPRGLNELRK